jgi:eukaryotic-like serine/threonine-protein kinase
MSGIPAKIGAFEVIRQIGTGGMGAVYLGRDPELDRQVAIKVIREEVHDQEVMDRFLREARAAAALRHANIITVYASGQENHRPYIAMEYIEGESLADIIKQRKNLPLTEKISLLEQVCAGLAFAHKAGIVHRDVKPANIMIDREGVVRVLDFGIARIEGSAMTQDGTMMGSLNYMSPEQMLGKPVDQRSDVFSVGSVAYELLCYHQAFKGNLNDGLLHRLPHEDPPLLKEIEPSVPLAIEQIVMRALEKDPGRRFQNLSDMRKAFVNTMASSRPSTTIMRPKEDDRTAVVARPKTNPPAPAPVPAPAAAGAARAGSPPPPTPRAVGRPPVASAPLSEILEPHSQLAMRPPAEGLKLKSEAASPPPPAPPVERTPALPPKAAALASAGIQIAASPPPAARRTATVATPPPVRRSSSKKALLIGAGVIVVAIGAAAAAIPWFNQPPLSPIEVEGPRIEAAMSAYRGAYRNRNLEGVVKVFPELPADTKRTMEQAFTNCLVYEVTFADMHVALDAADPNSAEVDVRSTYNCTPTSGGRQTESSRHEVFALKKIGDEWLIAGAAPVSAGRPQ